MTCRGCLQIVVKFLNMLLFVVGVIMILYSLKMLQGLHHRHHHDDDNLLQGRPFLLLATNSPKLGAGFSLPAPWFIYSFMGIGALACIITFSGYVAAEAASGCCLCCYSVSMGLFLLVQVILAAVVFFDKSWEEDFPEDPTGEIQRIRRFVESNAMFCQWVTLTVVVLEVLSLLFGMVLRGAVGDGKADENSDEDYEYVPSSSRPYTQGSGSSSRSNWTPQKTPQKFTASS